MSNNDPTKEINNPLPMLAYYKVRVPQLEQELELYKSAYEKIKQQYEKLEELYTKLDDSYNKVMETFSN